MHSHDDVVLGGAGVWHLRQGESTGAVSNGDGLHGSSSGVRVFEFERTRQSISLCAAHQADEVAHTGVTAVRTPASAHRTIILGDARTATDELAGRSDLAATACPSYAQARRRPFPKSSSSGRGSPGRVVRGAEFATGEGPTALLDAAVPRCVPACADMPGVHRLARPVAREREKVT
jgi:hypothetical protein